ncbi:hypothetical protein JCM10449v2_004676 [Rhodotorula kratochvilovae]
MRLTLAASLALLATSSPTLVRAAWLPALLTPEAGDISSLGDNVTISWDLASYNETAASSARFLLGYAKAGDEGTTVVQQFIGNSGKEGGAASDLWTGDGTLTFAIDVVSWADGLGQSNWRVLEYGTGEDVSSGEFTVRA